MKERATGKPTQMTVREKEEEGNEIERSGWRILMIAVRHSDLSNRGKTAQKKPDGQKQELVPSRRYAKVLVRKAARVT
jgi:hypothetical protein